MIEFEENEIEQLRKICSKHRVIRLDLFGSAAGGDFSIESSDLDFLVEFEELPPIEHKEAFFGLLEALKTLFNREIDLVETISIKNPYFRESVEGSRVRVYEST